MFFSIKFLKRYYWTVSIFGILLSLVGIYMGGFSKNLPHSVMLFLTVISFILAFLELLSLVSKIKWLAIIIGVLGITLGIFMFLNVPFDLISNEIIDITINAFAIIALGSTLISIGAKRLIEIDAS